MAGNALPLTLPLDSYPARRMLVEDGLWKNTGILKIELLNAAEVRAVRDWLTQRAAQDPAPADKAP
jgi:hypothetical protein